MLSKEERRYVSGKGTTATGFKRTTNYEYVLIHRINRKLEAAIADLELLADQGWLLTFFDDPLHLRIKHLALRWLETEIEKMNLMMNLPNVYRTTLRAVNKEASADLRRLRQFFKKAEERREAYRRTRATRDVGGSTSGSGNGSRRARR